MVLNSCGCGHEMKPVCNLPGKELGKGTIARLASFVTRKHAGSGTWHHLDGLAVLGPARICIRLPVGTAARIWLGRHEFSCGIAMPMVSDV